MISQSEQDVLFPVAGHVLLGDTASHSFSEGQFFSLL